MDSRPRRISSEVAALVEEILTKHPNATIPFVAVSMRYSARFRVLDSLRDVGRWDLHRKLSRRKRPVSQDQTVAMVEDVREVLPDVTLKTCSALLGYKNPATLRGCLKTANRRDLLLKFPDYRENDNYASRQNTLEDVLALFEGDPRITCEVISSRLGKKWSAIERALYRLDQHALVIRIKANNPKRQQKK